MAHLETIALASLLALLGILTIVGLLIVWAMSFRGTGAPNEGRMDAAGGLAAFLHRLPMARFFGV